MSSNKRNRFGYKGNTHETLLLSRYGITEEAYKALDDAQLGKCKLCRKSKLDTRFGKLDVDHDHQTGRIRGLLCSECNKMLGLAKDDSTTLLRAIQYLKGNL